MDPSTREDFLWLMSDEATDILQQTQEAFEERVNAVRIAKSLRSKTTPPRAAMVMEQAQLRIRGRQKFELADQMFFTRRGLEQSTGQDIAAYKATRFDGMESVADLCCGIGGDLQALVQRQGAVKTYGVDSDELTGLFAKHNAVLAVTRLGRQETKQKIRVRCREFANFDVSRFGALHCDPDRRMEERTVSGDRFSPRLQEVLQRIDSQTCLAIKIAPATPAPSCLPVSVQREWIGDRRECKQQVIWQGPFTHQSGHRTATCVDSNAQVHQFSVAEEEVEQTTEVISEIGKYLFEPHATVLASKLTDALANENGIARFCADIEYLTGDRPLQDPLLTQFEIVHTLPVDLRAAVKFLNEREIGQIEIKKRGVEHIIYDQFKRLKISGPRRATVILTRIGRKRIVIIARRDPSDFD
jgi:hypothetical protein